MKRLPVAAFAVLVALTVAAFFITQHLKTATPLVLSRTGGPPGPDPTGINPRDPAHRCRNVFGQRVACDVTKLRIRLEHSSEKVDVYVVDSSGDVVSTLSAGRFLRENQLGIFSWNGRDARGRPVRDGKYYFRIELAGGGGEELTEAPISVITRAPRPVITGVHPSVIRPGTSRAAIGFRPDGYTGAQVLIYRASPSGSLVQVTSFYTSPGGRATWNGMIGTKPAPAGSYLVGLRVKDQAGNLGTTPPTTDVVAGTTPGMGVSVRYVTATPPLTPTPAGGEASVAVDSYGSAYRWQLRTAGATAVLAHGSGHAATLKVPLPKGDADLYALTVSVGPHRATVPLVASAAGRAGAAQVLVVLPMLTWQGDDPVDDTGDGLPDTLGAGDPITLPRPLVAGLPAGFDQDAELLAYLRSQHVSYQLTTDIALALHEGPSLSGRRGVLLTGGFTWLPESLGPTLKAYVKGGGRLASIGMNTLQRQVNLVHGHGRLGTGAPARLQPDPFGARHGRVASTGGEIVAVLRDQLGLFGGTAALQGVKQYQSILPPDGTARVSLAGVAASAPAVTAFPLGAGDVVEVGLGGFVGSLVDAKSPAHVNSEELMTDLTTFLRR